MDGIGRNLEVLEGNKPVNFYYPLTQEYFTVYNTNAFLIGQIEDHDLRKLIVTTYTKARGLIDAYRLNNELLAKYEHWYWTSLQSGHPTHKKIAEEKYRALVDYAKTLKELHNDLSTNTKELLRALRKKGVLVEK